MGASIIPLLWQKKRDNPKFLNKWTIQNYTF